MTNWIYYNTGQSALLAVIYHASANTMGGAGFRLFDAPDGTRTFWLLALLNGVAATCVLVFTRTFRRKASVPVPTP